MFHNSSAIHPLWSGEDLSSINREANTSIESFNDGGVDPTDQLTPPPADGEMGRDQAPQEPLPPLKLKVQLPSRASFLANGVHQLELILLYGHLEQHVLLIDIHGPMMELPIQKPSETEISTSDNSATTPANSFPSSPPISNHGGGVGKELLGDTPPSSQTKITPRGRRGLKQSTTCKICHKKFSTKSDAAKHSFVHLSQEEKEAIKVGWRNKCYFCSKRFQTPSKLNIHLLVHTRENPHPCTKCSRKFAQKSGLTRHLRLHTQDPATRRPFPCEECDKSFTTNQHLASHVKTVHLGLKPFQCPECDQKFGQKGDLMRHLNGVHLGIRYPCRQPHCDKSFSFKVALRRHEKQTH